MEKEINKTVKMYENILEPYAFVTLIAFALAVASLFTPFYVVKDDSVLYEIIGTKDNGTNGCLGGCAYSNRPCILEDANLNCQVLQGLIITAAVLIGLSLLKKWFGEPVFQASMTSKIPFISTPINKLESIFSTYIMGITCNVIAVVLLIIALFVACFTDIGNQTTTLNERFERGEITYDAGFIFLIISLGCLLISIGMCGRPTQAIRSYSRR